VLVVPIAPTAATRRPAFLPAEQLDAVRDDLGRVLLLAVLVVPAAGLQAALDVDLLALLQVLVHGAAALLRVAEHLDAMPLDLVGPLVGFAIALPFRRRDTEADHLEP